MASAEAIYSKVWLGFAIAAGKLGRTYDHHRPADPMAPISDASRIGRLPAAFDPSPTLQFNAAPRRESETRATLVDGRVVQIGDYLIGPAGTHFIASREPLLPIQSVICNATVAVLRHDPDQDVGAVDYGHDTSTAEAIVLQGWPASLLVLGAGGGGGQSGIPGAPSDPGLEMLLPRLPDPALLINTGDVVRDTQDRRLIVTAAELTAHGWRCRLRLVAGG